jgi:hypothetical protein
MAFEKGQSGNPGGRPKEKAFADALRLAVNAEVEIEGEKKKKLRVIAERLVAEAMAGEGWAVQQVADRLDGKPAQAIIGGDDDDPSISLVHRIERVIVDPAKPADSESVQAAT